MRLLFFILGTMVLTSCSQKYYVVRHAEKGSSTSKPTDPPLSAEGSQRAEALRDLLKNKGIKKIYATPTQRAVATATPLSQALGLQIDSYGPMPDQEFLKQIKTQKNNILIVGHSNTVDDLVNGLTGSLQIKDLPDSVYNKLYIIRRSGQKTSLKQVNF